METPRPHDKSTSDKKTSVSESEFLRKIRDFLLWKPISRVCQLLLEIRASGRIQGASNQTHAVYLRQWLYQTHVSNVRTTIFQNKDPLNNIEMLKGVSKIMI